MYEVTYAHETGRQLAIVSYEARPEDIGRKAGEAFGTVAAYLARIGVAVTGPAVSCYTMGPETFQVASGFVVDAPFEPGEGVEPYRLPEGEVATTTHLGAYDQLGKAYDALREGVAAQGRRLVETGLMWEEYWSGPEAPPEETRTVIFWPVEPQEG